MLTSKIKLAIASVTEGVLIFAQVDPIEAVPKPSTSTVLDYGVTVAALGLLLYILRMILSGDLVSKSTIAAVVSQAVKEALEAERKG